MNEQQKLSNELSDIKQMMERSSRFISLSGLSGISAGICALIGAWVSARIIRESGNASVQLKRAIDNADSVLYADILQNRLFQVAAATFAAAFASAFIFTYRRSKKTNVPIWGSTAKRLTINVLVPMVAGGIFLLVLLKHGVYEFIAPGCLIFYGLGVLNASKYTLPETKYLGYGQILLGIISLFYLSYGLYFWAAGFGLLHILYGIFMWWKYERT